MNKHLNVNDNNEGQSRLTVVLGADRDIVDRLRDSQPEGTEGGLLLNDAATEIERLRAGYRRLKESSDLDMCDGDLARDIADEMLTPNAKLTGGPSGPSG